MGITLDPRALGDTAANFSAEGDKIVSHDGSSDPTFRNLVFFDSAEQRPGPDYRADTSWSARRLHRRGTRVDRPPPGRSQTLTGSREALKRKSNP